MVSGPSRQGGRADRPARRPPGRTRRRRRRARPATRPRSGEGRGRSRRHSGLSPSRPDAGWHGHEGHGPGGDPVGPGSRGTASARRRRFATSGRRRGSGRRRLRARRGDRTSRAPQAVPCRSAGRGPPGRRNETRCDSRTAPRNRGRSRRVRSSLEFLPDALEGLADHLVGRSLDHPRPHTRQ